MSSTSSWLPWLRPARPAPRLRVSLLAVFGVLSLFSGGSVLGGVADTPHNLTGARPGAGASADEAAALCAFCHTPQGGDQARPLWQRSLREEDARFPTYDSFGRSALDGIAQVGSVSVSCMSCHDGVQAGNVSTAVPVPIDEGTDRSQAEVNALRAPGRAYRPAESSISHPVGVPYGVWGDWLVDAALGGERFRPGPPDAATMLERGYREPERAVIDGVTVWWLEPAAGGDSAGADGRQRGDIHLYTRTLGSDGEAPFVECASCHDPHSERPFFLRTESAQSLCVSCHAL